MLDLSVLKDHLPLSVLEKALLELDQAEYEMNHTFSEGLYARQRFAKAGTLIIGKRHRRETMSILLKGTLSVYMDKDGPVKHIEAPCIWVTKAGSKRMTYSHTDTLLVTIHPTKETDLEKIETEFVIPEEEYLLQETKSIEGGGAV